MVGWTITPAPPEDTDAALRLLFTQAGPAEREQMAERTRRLLDAGELAASALRITRQGEQLLGVMLATPAPGSVGLVWPPQTLRIVERPAIEDALVQDVLSWLGAQGVKICQALLRPEEIPLGKPLLRNGFQHITSLSFLQFRLDRYHKPLSAEPALEFRPYDIGTHGALAATLLRTYQATLDCPELNGVRTIEETLAGHQAQGQFDPRRWWLARLGEEPVGVLLVNAACDDQAWEIIYMGLIPSVRGRGLGQELLAKALHEAQQAGVKKLTLSVDRRNQPALRLYRRVGFETVEQREVFLAILPPPR